MRKAWMILGSLLIAVLLVLGACEAAPAETITTKITQPATTVTQTVTPPATTIMETVTPPATTVTKTVTTTVTTTPPTTTPPTTTSPTTAPTTEQPQVITSPDGKLQIIDHKMTSNIGIPIIEGHIKNINSSTVNGEIKVEFYDAAGMILGTEVETINDLEPDKIASFKVQYTGTELWRVASYIISVSTIS